MGRIGVCFLFILLTCIHFNLVADEGDHSRNFSLGHTYVGLNHGNGFPAEGISPGGTVGFYFMENFAAAVDVSYIKALRYPETFNWNIEGMIIDFSFKKIFPITSIVFVSGGVGFGIASLEIAPKDTTVVVDKKYLEGFLEGGFEIFFTDWLSGNMLLRQRIMGLIDRGSGEILPTKDGPENFDISTYTMSASFGINVHFDLFN